MFAVAMMDGGRQKEYRVGHIFTFLALRGFWRSRKHEF